MRDIASKTTLKSAIAPQVATDNTPIVSSILDRQGCLGVSLDVVLGTIADADVTATVLLEESDAANMAGAAAVDDADLVGTEALAGFKFDNDGQCRKLGYVGAKRYIRATVTPANNAGNLPIAAIWRTEVLHAPAPNPPV